MAKRYDRYKFVKGGITFFIYSNAEDLLHCYFRDCYNKDSVEGYRQDGTKYYYSRKDLRKAVIEDGNWAYVRDKKSVHFWADKDTEFKRVLSLIAHEVAHIEIRPFYVDQSKEEIKAGRYETLTELAYDVAERIMK